MQVNPLSSEAKAVDVRPEDLAGDKNLTPRQKIAEASRQFEVILLQQILSEMQKPVIRSEFTDNSTASSIYQEMISSTLADDISKSGTFGLAKIFERQLDPPPAAGSKSQPAHETGRSNLISTKHHE